MLSTQYIYLSYCHILSNDLWFSFPLVSLKQALMSFYWKLLSEVFEAAVDHRQWHTSGTRHLFACPPAKHSGIFVLISLRCSARKSALSLEDQESRWKEKGKALWGNQWTTTFFHWLNHPMHSSRHYWAAWEDWGGGKIGTCTHPSFHLAFYNVVGKCRVGKPNLVQGLNIKKSWWSNIANVYKVRQSPCLNCESISPFFLPWVLNVITTEDNELKPSMVLWKSEVMEQELKKKVPNIITLSTLFSRYSLKYPAGRLLFVKLNHISLDSLLWVISNI